nr:hypothetical protein [Nostoc sp. DedVER01b]
MAQKTTFVRISKYQRMSVRLTHCFTDCIEAIALLQTYSSDADMLFKINI